MAEYEEVTGTIEVPKNVGIKGFLKAIEALLALPRVQSINIDARGQVEYRHFVREGEGNGPLEVTFDSLMPYAVIRNSRVVELGDPDLNAAVALGQLFNMAAADHLHPVALVGGANTHLWSWYESSTTIAPTSELAFWIAAITCVIGMPYACSRAGSRSTWYCFSKPPMEATSATPGTAVRA